MRGGGGRERGGESEPIERIAFLYFLQNAVLLFCWLGVCQEETQNFRKKSQREFSQSPFLNDIRLKTER